MLVFYKITLRITGKNTYYYKHHIINQIIVAKNKVIFKLILFLYFLLSYKKLFLKYMLTEASNEF
jgi:hypothetical protein